MLLLRAVQLWILAPRNIRRLHVFRGLGGAGSTRQHHVIKVVVVDMDNVSIYYSLLARIVGMVIGLDSR